MSDAPLFWGGTVSSEGAPFLVADLPRFARWLGGTGSREPGVYVAARGRLETSMPEALLKKRSFVDCEAATRHFADMVRDIRRLAPDARVRLGKETLSFDELLARPRLEDGDLRFEDSGTAMFVSCRPMTDYHRLVMCGPSELKVPLRSAPFEGKAMALWTSDGGCTAELGRRKGEWMLATHGHRAEPRTLSQLRRDLSSGAYPETPAGEVDFEEGIAVVCDAAFAAADLVEPGAEEQVAGILREAAKLEAPLAMNARGIMGVATMLKLTPGRYAMSEGSVEKPKNDRGPETRARWCRFRRIP